MRRRSASGPLNVPCAVCGNEPTVVTMEIRFFDEIELPEGRVKAGHVTTQHVCSECLRQAVEDMRGSPLTAKVKARLAQRSDVIAGARLAGVLDALDIMDRKRGGLGGREPPRKARFGP